MLGVVSHAGSFFVDLRERRLRLIKSGGDERYHSFVKTSFVASGIAQYFKSRCGETSYLCSISDV